MKSLLILLPFVFVGCSAAQPAADLPSDLPASVPGTALALPGADAIRNPEALKAYPSGRYQDPNDPALMHEGHTIYRAEQPATWNLNPTVPTAVPLGPTVAIADPAKQTVALTGELEQKIQQQNQLLQTTFQQNERLTDELKKTQALLESARSLAASNEALQRQVDELKAAMTRLQQQPVSAHAVTPAPPPPPAKPWWDFWSSSPSTPTPERKKP